MKIGTQITVTNISASSKLQVEYWIKKVSNFEGLINVDAVQQKDGNWYCDIELPVINKTVAFTSPSHVEAIKNACDEAIKVINKYMEDHHEIKVVYPFDDENVWVYAEDKGTNEVFITKSDEAMRKGSGWDIGY